MSNKSSLESLRMTSVRSAAVTVGLSERQIWKLIEAGKLRAHRFGRATRIPIADLESLVAQAALVPPGAKPRPRKSSEQTERPA